MKTKSEIARLRDENKKLRAELERVRDKCHAHWQRAQDIEQALQQQGQVAATWSEAHRQLADAIGRKQQES